MKRHQNLVLITIVFSVILVAETKVKLEDLPKAVQTAMKEKTQGATIIGASKEREDGRWTYEVETKVDGKSRDLTFDSNGTLLEVEQEVAIDRIPAAAKQAIEKKAAGGTIAKVESVTEGSNISYEADFNTPGGKKMEVAVNADGTTHKE